jgi:endoglucanase
MSRTPVKRHGRLRATGNRILDERGQPVTLRGMSLFWSQWKPQFYQSSTIAWLRDGWKADVVRAAMAVHHGGYLEHPEAEAAKVRVVIDAAIELGIYVIVDWHAHYPEAAAATRFFDEIAGRYAGHPNLIYETWNEPLPEHDWSTLIKPYHSELITVIRRHDPAALIVAGAQSWSQDVDKSAADPLPFCNVAYSLHFYAGSHGETLRAKASAALNAGAALMVTEWGTSEADGAGVLDVGETRLWWSFLEQNQLSDVNWSICDKEETSAALVPGACGSGGWPGDLLSPSGRMVRDRLRWRCREREAGDP